MAGIGEAASILGALQFGFSLAKTLNEYIGEFKTAADSITALANNIELTYRQTEDLQSLLNSKQHIQGFSESARINAVSCCLRAEKLGAELWQLLGKSNVLKPTSRDVKREDVDLSLFHQALWPRFKPRIEEADKKFMLLKMDITIAMVSYHGQSSLPNGSRDSDTLENLNKSRKLAVRELTAARKRRKAVRSRHAHFEPSMPKSASRRPSRDSDDPYERLSAPSRSGQSRRQDSYSRYDADNASITSSLYEEIEAKILKFHEEDTAKKEEAKLKQARVEDLARDKLETNLVKKFDDSRTRAESMRQRLSELFSVPPNDPAIDTYVGEQQTLALAGDEVSNKLITRLNQLHLAQNHELQVRNGTNPSQVSRLSRFWPLRKGSFQPSDRSKSQLQDSLRDVSFIGLVLHREYGVSYVDRVHLPKTWLSHALAFEEKLVMKEGGPPPTLRTYATLDASDLAHVARNLLYLGDDKVNTHLVYAKSLDKTPSRTRRIIRAAAFGSGRDILRNYTILLVYSIPREQGELHRPAILRRSSLLDNRLGGSAIPTPPPSQQRGSRERGAPRVFEADDYYWRSEDSRRTRMPTNNTYIHADMDPHPLPESVHEQVAYAGRSPNDGHGFRQSSPQSVGRSGVGRSQYRRSPNRSQGPRHTGHYDTQRSPAIGFSARPYDQRLSDDHAYVPPPYMHYPIISNSDVLQPQHVNFLSTTGPDSRSRDWSPNSRHRLLANVKIDDMHPFTRDPSRIRSRSRPSTASRYRRWASGQNQDHEAETEEIEGSGHNQYFIPTAHSVAAEDESNGDDDNSSSESELSDTSNGIANGESWQKLKAEAAILEQQSSARSRGRRSVGSRAFTEPGTHISESPTGISQVGEALADVETPIFILTE